MLDGFYDSTILRVSRELIVVQQGSKEAGLAVQGMTKEQVLGPKCGLGCDGFPAV
jgi:hypothetical protein